jgi:hypothetical protein
MTDVPAYFEAVRSRAAKRWDQLEQDPVLAGPWHQLFKQVQSPRHVVSELLQNADDAGAKKAFIDTEDGGWLERATGVSFPWERYSASGELLQCYWVKDHCIEREPLQLEADVWDLCVKHPEKYTLLLASLDGAPVEYSGKRICDLRDSGRLTLFPASYRIVYDHDM